MSEDGGKSWRGAEEYSGSAVLPPGPRWRGWNGTAPICSSWRWRVVPWRDAPTCWNFHCTTITTSTAGAAGTTTTGAIWGNCRRGLPGAAPESSPGESVFSPGPETWENLPPPSAEPGEAARPATGTGESAAEPSGGSGLAVQALPAPEPEKAAPALWPFLLGGALALAAERRCWACVHTAPAGMGSGERGRTAMREKQRFSPAFALALGAVVLASCALFLFCYRADNKYTAPRPVSSPA